MAETAANTAHLRRSNLWSSQLKDVLEDELSAQAWLRWLTDLPDGDTFNVPSIGDLPVRNYAEDTPVVYDSLDTGNFTFTIGEYVSSATYITKKALQDGYYMSELVASFVPKQARAIMEKLETDIRRELGEELVADGLVTCGLVGVAADHEPVPHRPVIDDELL